MKTDTITKGYAAITDKQRAALYFYFVTKEDGLEAARVLSAVPRKAYRMSNLEFAKWHDGFSRVANVFAREHWIARHGLVAAALQLEIVSTKDENDIVKELKVFETALAEFELRQKLLLSLDAALLAAADKHGFEVQCVYIRARTVPYKTENERVTADDEMRAAWVDIFDSILDSPFG